MGPRLDLLESAARPAIFTQLDYAGLTEHRALSPPGPRCDSEDRRAGVLPQQAGCERKRMRLLAAIGASLAMWAFIMMGVVGLLLKVFA